MIYKHATAAALLSCLWLLVAIPAVAQPGADPPAVQAPAVQAPNEQAPADSSTPEQPASAPADDAPPTVRISLEQEQIAERFRRLEELMLRMAELTATEDPARAALLRQTVAKGKERLVGMQFERIVELLGADRLTNAVTSQGEIMQDLKTLLDLLMSEDRAKRLKTEQERIREYLKEVNKLIKDQQGIQAQTDRGGQLDRLAERQENLADRTDKLGQKIRDDEAEAQGESPDDKKASESSDGKPSEGESSDGKPSEGEPSEEDTESADGKPGDKPNDESNDEKTEDEKPSEDAGEPKEPSAEEGKPQDGESPPEGESSGKPSESGKPQPGGEPSPGEGEPSEGDAGQQTPPPQNDTEQRLQNAQQRMKEAREKLEEALREEAVDKQEEALRELEAAKAELEKILRQMREEEMARLLAMLEARFRKMLDMQVEVYEGTIRLDRLPAESRGRGSEIESGRLSRSESQIVIEADKALTLLREEGSAVAMPEALEQTRDDMQQVMQKLAEFDVGALTQGVEEDIIASLEEMIAALEKAQQELESQQNQQQPPPPPGEPQEPPLIDQLAELRMIRSLQMRVNRRTATYAKLIDGERADRPELLQALNELAERQNRIYRTTRDIVVGRNQ